MTTLTFTAWGRPVGQGNHQRNPHGFGTYEATYGHAGWRAELIRSGRAAAAELARNGTPWLCLDGPVDVDVVFYGPRPKGHYGTGRNADIVKPSAAPLPILKGAGETAIADLDKLCRSVLDGLKLAGLIADDCLVVDLHASKRYAAQPAGARAIIDVRPHPQELTA